MAAGELHIYNWGDYTNPKLIEKFEKETGIKVTLDGYDSNETMLAKVRAGGSGYDIVVPSDYTVKIMIDEGMLAETKPNQMPNFKNVKPRVRRHLLGQGPQLHGALAVRHHRLRRQHRQVQGRHQHLCHPVRSAGRAEGPDQHARRRECR